MLVYQSIFLSRNLTSKKSNIIKRNLSLLMPTPQNGQSWLSVFDHSVVLVPKGLKMKNFSL